MAAGWREICVRQQPAKQLGSGKSSRGIGGRQIVNRDEWEALLADESVWTDNVFTP